MTKPPAPGYNGAVYFRSYEEKSTLFLPEREPRKVRGGAAMGAEHGLGAEPLSRYILGKWFRFVPLQAFEARTGCLCESRWYRVSFCRPWAIPRVLFYLGGQVMCEKCRGNYYWKWCNWLCSCLLSGQGRSFGHCFGKIEKHWKRSFCKKRRRCPSVRT